MSDLDKKLEEIIARCDYSNNMIEPISNPVWAIRQLFVDEGWRDASVYSTRVVTTEQLKSEFPDKDKRMTGKEWYEKFMIGLQDWRGFVSKEYNDGYANARIQAIEAAKKASGIEGE
jgi:hypothetical protein